MNFRDTAEQADFRAEVRAYIRENLPEEVRGLTALFYNTRSNPAFKKWTDALARRNWVAPAWPREYGGGGLSVREQFIMNQELAEARAPKPGGLGTMMLGPTLIEHGSAEQKAEHLPKILSGEVLWCQGYSEPGAGSDLAGLQTRAVRDGDDWVVSGQKIWTSVAHFADWCFCLARSDPEAPKHRGISYFLIDMQSPGISVQPLVNMAGGHDFNEVFFEDVRVPAANVVGEVNRGWYVGATTLDFERSSIGAAVGLRQTITESSRWLRDRRSQMSVADHSRARVEWADRAIEVQVAALLGYRIVSMQDAGQIPNQEASIAKLFGSELGQRVAGTRMRMIGIWGGLADDPAPFGGQASRGYVESLSGTIAGGTSEIQRNIIASRGLGLPRD